MCALLLRSHSGLYAAGIKFRPLLPVSRVFRHPLLLPGKIDKKGHRKPFPLISPLLLKQVFEDLILDSGTGARFLVVTVNVFSPLSPRQPQAVVIPFFPYECTSNHQYPPFLSLPHPPTVLLSSREAMSVGAPFPFLLDGRTLLSCHFFLHKGMTPPTFFSFSLSAY